MIIIASCLMYYEQIKYIKIDYHFMCEKIHKNRISNRHVKIREQLNGILMKALNGSRVKYLYNKSDIINIYTLI